MGFMDSEAAKLFTHWYVVLLTFVPPFNFFFIALSFCWGMLRHLASYASWEEIQIIHLSSDAIFCIQILHFPHHFPMVLQFNVLAHDFLKQCLHLNLMVIYAFSFYMWTVAS